MGNYHKARELAGLTIEEAAARLGITVSSLTNWESGKVSPPALGIIELCKLYQRTADELIGVKPLVNA